MIKEELSILNNGLLSNINQIGFKPNCRTQMNFTELI